MISQNQYSRKVAKFIDLSTFSKFGTKTMQNFLLRLRQRSTATIKKIVHCSTWNSVDKKKNPLISGFFNCGMPVTGVFHRFVYGEAISPKYFGSLLL